MCLIVKSLDPSISSKDISCYKILYIAHECDPHDERAVLKRFRTPYQDYDIYFDEVLVDSKEVDIDQIYNGEFCVESGGFHSFKNFHDAHVEALKLIAYFGKSFKPVIAKCIIPAGTPYYEGKYNDAQSYASKKIMILSQDLVTNIEKI